VVKKVDVLGTLHTYFSENNNFLIIPMKDNCMNFYRLSDGELFGKLDFSRFRPLFAACSGSGKVIQGVIDFVQREVFNLEELDLLHIFEGRIDVYNTDVSKQALEARP